MEFIVSQKKFHGIPRNFMELDKFDIQNHISEYWFVIWLMIICYLTKMSQKCYILYW